PPGLTHHRSRQAPAAGAIVWDSRLGVCAVRQARSLNRPEEEVKICNNCRASKAPALLPSRRICENKDVSHQTLQVAVIGVGSFGRNHARVYKELSSEGVQLAAIVDANLERAQTVAAEYGGQAFASVGQMLAACPDVRAASVAVPTVAHLETA